MSVTLATGVTLIDFLNKSLETLKLIQQEKADSTELHLHLATLTQQLGTTMVEASQLQGILAQKNEEIRQLQQKLDEKVAVKFHPKSELYWADDDPVPYCTKCYENDGKLLHLYFYEGRDSGFGSTVSSFDCSVCKSEYPRFDQK
ncbi:MULTISPECIES: hypothetical protein [Vibrio]|uniref:hypothetical protein n=1 Tax=Vibrio TaxID=662 RepID=UPI0002FA6155|nr:MULTISPECIES: hypothetical protein [Vibrio]EJX1093081.1 hypothetical protein [Vibrio vulnificus]MCG8706570.1 hypothetical protein [Vibrio vulnificus]OEF06997.1 hypothetical protein A1QI_18275 [Vibrio genomosp. F10 str. 9ZB36]HAS8156453.1 hypothetical protein [Vibrio vulnificus]HAS8488470.1 hypothetical protein [Vibrio vulnificus]